ncbi:MAG: nuclear transport factor 2 family protein [Actinomycetota bacterium]
MSSEDADLGPRELSDRARIHDLLTIYAAAVDARDWDRLRTVFSKDAVLDYHVFGGPRGSVDEAVEWLDASLSKVEMTQHFITNVLIQSGSDTSAEVRSLVFNPLGANERTFLLGGSYRDRVERTADGWRIAERVATFTWSDRPLRPPTEANP